MAGMVQRIPILMHTLTNGVTTMTVEEQLRKDFEKISARRNSAEVLLAQERATNFEHMRSIKYLRERFELLETEFNALKERWKETFKEEDDADSS